MSENSQSMETWLTGALKRKSEPVSTEARHEIIVGNTGCIYSGHDEQHAAKLFNEYRALSIEGHGLVGNEPVTWLEGDSIRDEHMPEGYEA